MQPRKTDIEREIEADYVLERMQEVRDIIHELLESIQFDRITYHEAGAESALEAVAAATFTVENAWTAPARRRRCPINQTDSHERH